MGTTGHEHGAPPDAMLGQVLDGRYRLDAAIGEGGMGVVYRATHVRLGKEVAVKVLRRVSGDGSEMIRRFLKEARMATAIRHPNVVELSDCGELPDGRAFMVMELLRGETLADRLGRIRRLPPVHAVALSIEIGAGLEAAHARGIVHRDLKPENVFLALGDDGETVKLLDFGVARALDSRDTLPGAVLGTPEYMAPEQARGEAVDARADLYALGVMLLEMLAGDVPHRGDDIGELLLRKLSTDAPVLRTMAPDLAGDAAGIDVELVESLIATLLSRRPEDRPDAVAVVRRVLQRALGKRTDAPRPAAVDAAPSAAVTEQLGSAPGGRTPAPAATPPRPQPGAWDPALVDTARDLRDDLIALPVRVEGARPVLPPGVTVDPAGLAVRRAHRPIASSPTIVARSGRRRGWPAPVALGGTAVVVLAVGAVWLATRSRADADTSRDAAATSDVVAPAADVVPDADPKPIRADPPPVAAPARTDPPPLASAEPSPAAPPRAVDPPPVQDPPTDAVRHKPRSRAAAPDGAVPLPDVTQDPPVPTAEPEPEPAAPQPTPDVQPVRPLDLKDPFSGN